MSPAQEPLSSSLVKGVPPGQGELFFMGTFRDLAESPSLLTAEGLPDINHLTPFQVGK